MVNYFPGISLIVHLGIIMVYRVAKRINSAFSFKLLRRRNTSSIIIITVCFLIVISAFLMGKIIIKDNNFQMAKKLLPSASYASASSTSGDSAPDFETLPVLTNSLP